MRNLGVREVLAEKQKKLSEFIAFDNIQGLISYLANRSTRRQKEGNKHT